MNSFASRGTQKNWNRELVSRVDQKVLRWFGHMERMEECMSTAWLEGCLWQKYLEFGYGVDGGLVRSNREGGLFFIFIASVYFIFY